MAAKRKSSRVTVAVIDELRGGMPVSVATAVPAIGEFIGRTSRNADDTISQIAPSIHQLRCDHGGLRVSLDSLAHTGSRPSLFVAILLWISHGRYRLQYVSNPGRLLAWWCAVPSAVVGGG